MRLTSAIGKGALAATLAVGATIGTAGAAFADVTADPIPTSTVETTSDYVRGAATRAAMPSIEILGLNSVEESGQFVTMVDGRPQYDWNQPKYFIDASYYNQNLSPLLANLATGLGTDDYPAAAYLSGRSGGGAGPNASLGANDTSVWALSPRLVVGTGGADWQSIYAAHDATGVTYGFNDYDGLIDTMNALAVAADGLATDEVGLRFGDATDIADAYAAYINGTVDYIKDKTSGKALPTVALVTAYEDGVYTIAPTLGQDGTASQNRYIETTVATGLAENLNDSPKDSAVVEAGDLEDVDLIMIGGQSGSGNFQGIYDALNEDGLLDQTYFVMNNGTQGSTYGVTMNSVENAQNIGRILGMLYPDVIDQQSWMAYYYEEFYHIKSDDLAYVMNHALDGVRCATNHTGDLSDWDVTTAYAANWSHDKVAKAIGVLPADGE